MTMVASRSHPKQGKRAGKGAAGRDERQARRHSDHLVQQIEEMIFSGRLKPGEKLDEVALAAEFGVSRTPVREAIQRLTASGLIETQSRKGTSVTLLPMSKLVGMFEVMAELDILCARLAAQRATQQERRTLQDIYKRSLEATGDPVAYARLNRDFHTSIYAATHNAYLETLAARTWKQLQPYRNFRLDRPERVQESAAQHKAVLDAILAYDAELAAKTMRTHVRLGTVLADFVLNLPVNVGT
jgi:DNA-binding GntR family transcriptional regulator